MNGGLGRRLDRIYHIRKRYRASSEECNNAWCYREHGFAVLACARRPQKAVPRPHPKTQISSSMIGDYRSPSDTDLPLCSQVLHAPCRNRYGFAAGLVVTHY
jgi:hypothetical protein